MKKIKQRVKVSTPSGDKYLVFTPIDPADADVVCVKCPYNGICDKISDPRFPEDKEKSFIDFCSSATSVNYVEGVTKEDDEEAMLVNYVPEEGTIERVLDTDLFQNVLKNNPPVLLNDVVDSVCSGWCDMYNKDHTNCTCDNKSCILNDLLSKIKK